MDADPLDGRNADDLETRLGSMLSLKLSQLMQAQEEKFMQAIDAQQKAHQGELEALRAELAGHQATPPEENSVDPEGGPYWSLNAIAVACWKASCWPLGMGWNEDSGSFEPLVISIRTGAGSNSRCWF